MVATIQKADCPDHPAIPWVKVDTENRQPDPEQDHTDQADARQTGRHHRYSVRAHNCGWGIGGVHRDNDDPGHHERTHERCCEQQMQREDPVFEGHRLLIVGRFTRPRRRRAHRSACPTGLHGAVCPEIRLGPELSPWGSGTIFVECRLPHLVPAQPASFAPPDLVRWCERVVRAEVSSRRVAGRWLDPRRESFHHSGPTCARDSTAIEPGPDTGYPRCAKAIRVWRLMFRPSRRRRTLAGAYTAMTANGWGSPIRAIVGFVPWRLWRAEWEVATSSHRARKRKGRRTASFIARSDRGEWRSV